MYSFNEYAEYNEAHKIYFQEIKTAKSTSWNEFLENADFSDVYFAYLAYKFCKSRKNWKTFCIKDKWWWISS